MTHPDQGHPDQEFLDALSKVASLTLRANDPNDPNDPGWQLIDRMLAAIYQLAAETAADGGPTAAALLATEWQLLFEEATVAARTGNFDVAAHRIDAAQQLTPHLIGHLLS